MPQFNEVKHIQIITPRPHPKINKYITEVFNDINILSSTTDVFTCIAVFVEERNIIKATYEDKDDYIFTFQSGQRNYAVQQFAGKQSVLTYFPQSEEPIVQIMVSNWEDLHT
jgi:hypothetical protein